MRSVLSNLSPHICIHVAVNEINLNCIHLLSHLLCSLRVVSRTGYVRLEQRRFYTSRRAERLSHTPDRFWSAVHHLLPSAIAQVLPICILYELTH